MSMLFAATYPQRTIAALPVGSMAKRIWSADYPWAPTWRSASPRVTQVERDGARSVGWVVRRAEPRMTRAFAALRHATTVVCASPGAALALCG